MRVAKMPHIYTETRKDKETDRETKREVYYRRFPKDVQTITGAKFVHKWPLGVSRQQANDDTTVPTEFNRKIAEARQKLAPREPPLLRVRQNGPLPWQVSMEHVPVGAVDQIEPGDKLYNVEGVAVANPKARVGTEPVEYDDVLLSWKNANRLNDTDKKYRHMDNRWRDFFTWLVERRGYPSDCRDMARITTDDLDEYKEHFKALMNAADPKVRISSKTMEDYLRQITGLYKYAIKEMRKKALAAITAGFHVPKGETAPGNKYVDFDPYEISHILIKARSAPPEIRWPNWIAAYSGARLAEVVEAQTNDVETVENGIVIFHIRRENRPGKQSTLKTGEISERPVPLHEAVLDEGDGAFLAYVQWVRDTYYDGGHGPLFPQFELWRGRLNNDASKRLLAWLRDPEIGPGITHPRKVFHSWRHTTKTRFRGVDENDIPYISREDVADKLTGHASGKIGRTYGIFPNSVLAAAMRRVPAWPL